MADLSKEEQEFKEVFNTFDKNSDGSICTKELGAALQKIGREHTEADLEEMMKVIDSDGNGTLDFPEFVTVMKNATIKLKAQETFKKFDTDGSGFITKEELRKGLDDTVSDDKVEEMITRLDVNGDDKVSYIEFLTLMIRTIRKK